MSSSSSGRWIVFTVLAFFPAACAPLTERNDSAEDRILEERAREYFDERFRFYPVEATVAGVHAYDGELGRFEVSQITSRVRQLRDLRQRLLGIDLAVLSWDGFVDALWLTSTVKAELFELEQIEPWRKSPGFYADVICRGVSSLLEPWGSPRVDALLSRLGQVPLLLQAAIGNLENPSPLALEEGLADLETCQETIADLPRGLEGFSHDARADEIERAARQAGEHIQGFISHLENDVTPAGPDSFRWGEEKLRLQLLYREMEETPLQTIRLIAERELSDTRDRVKELAVTLDRSSMTAEPSATSAEQQDPLGGEVMEPTEELVSATGKLLATLRQWVSEREMTESVSEAPIPAVKVSRFVPPHVLARLEAPGPLDPSSGAVFLLAPPKESPTGRIPGPAVPYELQALAMREVYPGKYFRLVTGRGQAGRSDLRRLLISRANREGWAHYAETTLLDEGYAGADPRLKMASLQHLALEQTRLVTAILLHAGDLSLSTATNMFVNEADLDPLTAEREARRVALDPNVMSASLGRLQIMKLRRDFLGARGDTTASREFHRAFLCSGELPLRLVRLLLLSRGEGQTLED
ncbi:MAG TPA: DUF885 family protein [Vicinamibacteria bacterium]|jgi:hypothetical protein